MERTKRHELKKIALFILVILFTFAVNAQEKEVCDNFIRTLRSAINTKSSQSLDPWISEEFEILGQEQPLASKVLHMLIAQLNDSVVKYSERTWERSDNSLSILYDIEYKHKGKRVTEVAFNENNKVSYLKLIEGEVKTLQQSDKPKIRNTTGSSVISFPVNIINKMLLTEIVVNGNRQQFILDSGAARTVLNATYHNSTNSLSNTKGVHNSSVSGMDIVNITSLELQDITLENERLLTADLSHLETSLGVKVHGILGADILEHFDLVLDYPNQMVTLVDPDSFEYYKDTHLKGQNFYDVPFITQKNHLPVIQLHTGNNAYNMAVDTGASSNAMTQGLWQTLSSSLTNITTDTLRGVSKTSKEIASGILPQVSLGNINFEQIHTVFTNLDHLNKGEGVKLDGIIGYEILSKQKTILSFKRKEMLIEKK